MGKSNETIKDFDQVFPIIPLRDVVIFPSMATAILVGRQPSINAVERAIESDKILLVITQKNPVENEPGPEDLYKVGTVVRIGLFFRLPDGTIKLMLEGINRVKIKEYIQKDNYLAGKVEPIEERDSMTRKMEALTRKVESLFSDYVRMNHRLPNEVLLSTQAASDGVGLADMVAAHLIIRNEIKQQLLETEDLEGRFMMLSGILAEELEILKVEKDIDDKVSNQVQKSQKELFLHEKMRAIRDELGHGDEMNQFRELKRKIRKARLSRDAQKIAYKELDRLKMMSPMTPEATVVRNYLDWLTALPWQTRTKDNLNIDEVKKKLDADHYGLVKVKERILEFLSVMKLVKNLKGPILCFVGPPGVGKTSLGKSIADAVGRKFVRISLGGTRDEAEIRGHRRTYIGSMPGRIIQGIKKAGTRNPVFLLDEIDKLSSDFRGDPSSALLEVLDPEQNKNFSDNYLEVEFDVSEVMFITTANVIYSIPPALQDRMEIIRLPGYLLYEKIKIAQKFVIPKQLKAHGIMPDQLKISEAALKEIVQKYTRESGVRNLERELASICRKVAKKLAMDEASGKVRLTKKNVETYLGIPKFTESEIEKKLTVGVVTGLAWTEAGGEILNIEVTLMPGKGELILTGQLGDVMQESAKIALSFARTRSRLLDLGNDFFSTIDIHVHVPEGAIPKDGPSAGVVIATALISALFDIPVKREIAMTGELTLRGKVLPIGGINEKSVAALRAGVKTLLLPKENEKNIKELPEEVRKKMKIIVVDSMDQILENALSKKLDWGVKHRRRMGGFFGAAPSDSAN